MKIFDEEVNDYYFYVNNKEVKADNCFSNFFGYSQCTYNGETYTNLEYKTVNISTTPGLITKYNVQISIIILAWIIILMCFVYFDNFVRGK